MKKIQVTRDWVLFLDRDGVINERIPGEYITDFNQFRFLDGVLEFLEKASGIFKYIILVTNQQGIGKGIMTESELDLLHECMIREVRRCRGKIDAIYYCGDKSTQSNNRRKPKTDMAYWAREDFPDIDFMKSIMVGDSITDMDFGKRLEMQTVLVGECLGYTDQDVLVDYVLEGLPDLLSVLECEK